MDFEKKLEIFVNFFWFAIGYLFALGVSIFTLNIIQGSPGEATLEMTYIFTVGFSVFGIIAVVFGLIWFLSQYEIVKRG
ncbi:hypothetical protein 15570_00013 [Lokiarchaeota virus WyrdV1]|nr:hypothetical protein 15570_00013 [Lokiarchaeota virus WyrdV1]